MTGLIYILKQINHVELGSPANQGGLLKDDVLIKVNRFNVCNENHQQVVSRIKENIRQLKSGDADLVQLVTSQPMCVEPFREYSAEQVLDNGWLALRLTSYI